MIKIVVLWTFIIIASGISAWGFPWNTPLVMLAGFLAGALSARWVVNA